MAADCRQLTHRHETAWREATVHPFLEGCRTGTITPQQFETWLVQDYLFVVEFTRFAARVLVAAPVEHFDVLLDGLTALRDELSWFRTHAAARSLRLDVLRQESCAQYCRFMDQLAHTPYPVQATAFWVIEAVYNFAWHGASPMAPPYDEFARRWGSPEFGAYVEQLRRQADEALSSASGTEQTQAEAAFLDVLRLERSFWQMAFECPES